MSITEVSRPRQSRSRPWTEREVLEALRAAGQERGRWWTMREWEAARRRPTITVVYAVIGSWAVAWTRAGFRPPARWGNRGPLRFWTKAELIEQVRLAADGRYLPHTRYERWARSRDGPCCTTVRKRLGPSWTTVLRRCGLPERAPRIASEELVAALIRLWRAEHQPPTRIGWDRWTDRPAARAQVIRVFGSWEAFLDQARCAAPDLPETRGRSSAVAHLLALPETVLTDRERQLAALFRAGASLEEAGAELGVTRERARQLALGAGRTRSRSRRRTGERRADAVLGRQKAESAPG